DADIVAVHPDGHALHPRHGCTDVLLAGRDDMDHVPADHLPQQRRVYLVPRTAELPGRDAADVRTGAGAHLRVDIYRRVRGADQRRPCPGSRHAAAKLGRARALYRADGMLRRRDGRAFRRDSDVLAVLSAARAHHRALSADFLGRLLRLGAVAGTAAALDAVVALRAWHAVDALRVLRVL